MWESHASAMSALTSSRPTEALAFVECAADDLRCDRRRSRRHPDDGELTVGFDPGRGEAAPSKFGDHRAKRSTLAGRELARRCDDVIIDIERRAHRK